MKFQSVISCQFISTVCTSVTRNLASGYIATVSTETGAPASTGDFPLQLKRRNRYLVLFACTALLPHSYHLSLSLSLHTPSFLFIPPDYTSPTGSFSTSPPRARVRFLFDSPKRLAFSLPFFSSAFPPPTEEASEGGRGRRNFDIGRRVREERDPTTAREKGARSAGRR